MIEKRQMIVNRALAGFAMTLSSALHAQETFWYVAADLGQSRHRTTSADVIIVGGAFEQKDTQTGFAVGGRFHQRLAIELGYADFGKSRFSGFGAFPCPPLSACTLAIFQIDGNARVKATHLSLIANAPLADALSVYGRLGAARTDRSATVRVGNVTVSSSDEKTELIYGVGLGYAFSKDIEATLEWKKLADSKADSTGLGVRFRF